MPIHTRWTLESRILERCTRMSMVAFVSMALVSCGEEQAKQDDEPTVRPIKSMTITRVAQQPSRSYPARVMPAQEVVVSFRVSGQILELPIFAGKEVNQGDVLAKLDMRDLETNKVALESQLEQAQAQLDAMLQGARAEDLASLQASVAAAEAQRDVAQQQVDRTQTLFDRGSATKAKLDSDQGALKVAEAQLESARQELKKGEAGSRKEDLDAQRAAIKALEAQLQNARNNLDYATLRAPFAGIIATRDVENFANIQAKEPVARLQRISRLDLEFDVPGSDVARFSRTNNPVVKAELDALPERVFSAQFVDFNTQADTATQTFRARVSIEPPSDTMILPGMTGTIRFRAREAGEPVILIPFGAVASSSDGSSFVWAIEDGKVAQRPVSVGETRQSSVVIESGLSDGDKIAIAGLHSLQEGMSVKPINKVGD